MKETFEQYQDTISMLEAVLEEHPEVMCELSEAEQEVLWNYYFSGRELEPAELERRWERLMEYQPDLPVQAQVALASFQQFAKSAVVAVH